MITHGKILCDGVSRLGNMLIHDIWPFDKTSSAVVTKGSPSGQFLHSSCWRSCNASCLHCSLPSTDNLPAGAHRNQCRFSSALFPGPSSTSISWTADTEPLDDNILHLLRSRHPPIVVGWLYPRVVVPRTCWWFKERAAREGVRKSTKNQSMRLRNQTRSTMTFVWLRHSQRHGSQRSPLLLYFTLSSSCSGHPSSGIDPSLTYYVYLTRFSLLGMQLVLTPSPFSSPFYQFILLHSYLAPQGWVRVQHLSWNVCFGLGCSLNSSEL